MLLTLSCSIVMQAPGAAPQATVVVNLRPDLFATSEGHGFAPPPTRTSVLITELPPDEAGAAEEPPATRKPGDGFRITDWLGNVDRDVLKGAVEQASFPASSCGPDASLESSLAVSSCRCLRAPSQRRCARPGWALQRARLRRRS